MNKIFGKIPVPILTPVVLSILPVLFFSYSAVAALSAGVCVFVILILTSAVSLAARKLNSALYIIISVAAAAVFTAGIQVVYSLLFPAMYKMLADYFPMCCVSTLLFVSKKSEKEFLPAIFESVLSGIAFTVFITAIGCIRELLGTGTLFEATVTAGIVPTALIFTLPCGALLVVAAVACIADFCDRRRKCE